MDFHACNCVFKIAYLYKLVNLDYKYLQKCRSFFFVTSIVLFFISFSGVHQRRGLPHLCVGKNKKRYAMNNKNGWITFFCRLILCILVSAFVVGPFIIPSEFGMLGQAATSVIDFIRYVNASEICAENSLLHPGVKEACDYRDAYLAK